MVLSEPGPTPVCPFGPLQEDSDPPISESLSIENALWAGTVIASGEGRPREERGSNLRGEESPRVQLEQSSVSGDN